MNKYPRNKYMKTFNLKFSFHIDRDSFLSLNWRIFIITAILGFLLSFVSHLSIKLPIISPLSYANRQDVFVSILPKLEKIPNQFSLHKKTTLIAKSYAGSTTEYDKAASYIAVNYDTGEIIASKNSDQKLPIASITKIATAVTALDLADSTELFTASSIAASEIPTKIGLVPGQKLTLSELLHALLLTSANDAAQMIREGIDEKYSSDVFIKAMNAKAKFLGLKNTSFANPQGFDSKNNYSTVEDLAILTHYALNNYPLISEIVKKDYAFLEKNANHKQYDLYNWNGLLGVYPNIEGVKIGNTDKAGKTTAVVSQRNGKKIIAILLGAPGVLERDLWTAQLLDYSFSENFGLNEVGITEDNLRAKYSTWRYLNLRSHFTDFLRILCFDFTLRLYILI